jgi:hypothetical protein
MIRSTGQHDAVGDGKIGGRNPTSRQETAERRKVKRYLTAQYAITDLLADADTLRPLFPKYYRRFARSSLGCGRTLILDQVAKSCAVSELWHPRRQPDRTFGASVANDVSVGRGFLMHLGNSKPLWIDNLRLTPGFSGALPRVDRADVGRRVSGSDGRQGYQGSSPV